MAKYECRVCGADHLHELGGYGHLPRVTSDCKPFPAGGRLAVCRACGAVQKPADARWQQEIDGIYGSYEIYFQSAGGAEQAVFDPSKGVPNRRSTALLERVAAERELPERGKLIDVGCGKGALLRAFAEFRPRWELYGHELAPHEPEVLHRIPGFKELYSGPVDRLPDGFDVITLMHSLEHFVDPLAGLRDLRSKLSDRGVLLVEVPNAAVSPFDLAIADHASHFSRQHLTRLMQRAGLGSVIVADDWITKELSGVAGRDGTGEVAAFPAGIAKACLDRVSAQLEWLQAVLAAAHALTDANATRFGLFGTSIASMWLFGELGDKVDFFVDEDPSRQHTLHGRPVYSPDRAPEGSTVYLALIPAVARALAKRLARPGLTLECPPELRVG